jgi:hypothetical protein
MVSIMSNSWIQRPYYKFRDIRLRMRLTLRSQCSDANSNQAALNMLNYLQGKDVGLLAIAYDLPNNPPVPRDERASTYEQATPSTLVDTGCADASFGPGTIIQSWYRTRTVPGYCE